MQKANSLKGEDAKLEGLEGQPVIRKGRKI